MVRASGPEGSRFQTRFHREESPCMWPSSLLRSVYLFVSRYLTMNNVSRQIMRHFELFGTFSDRNLYVLLAVLSFWDVPVCQRSVDGPSRRKQTHVEDMVHVRIGLPLVSLAEDVNVV
ncbi:hypothetical protein AVEN_69928-1 [Araneus ventricosus]|uniref:Uncharacterized protein n=1 Tax=Araneus ventricosus TaxID=182803 RepID=A0A4Y2VTK6_ARAVE|nr:hypothetical protein AVEN_69928-1 [Araneus ventricosus]